jgi:HTH-type transcriptional regulator/antitoxin HipB
MPTDRDRHPTWSIRSPEDLGRAIAGARKRRGLSQEELAGQLGISRSYLAELETGPSSLAVERSLRALRRLGARVSVTMPSDHGG